MHLLDQRRSNKLYFRVLGSSGTLPSLILLVKPNKLDRNTVVNKRITESTLFARACQLHPCPNEIRHSDYSTIISRWS